MNTLPIARWQKVLAAAIAITGITSTTNAVAAELLRGAGDSFAKPLYQRYSQEYAQQTGEKFKYTTIGSGGGIRLFINKSIDFAATNLIPTPIEQNQIKDGLLMLPTGGSAVAIVYNLQNVSQEVKLSRSKLAQIFSGKITNWQQVNPSFPSKRIQVVVCANSCGTSYILTKYLHKITEGEITASRSPEWGFSVYAALAQDSAIAAEVRRVDGAIGYVQRNFAIDSNLTIASLENKSGNYLKPTLEATQKALGNIKFNDDFTTEDIADPEDGYPLASLTWILVYQKYTNEETLKSTKNLLLWILTKGQALNEQLEYTRIPEDTAKKAEKAVNDQLRISPY